MISNLNYKESFSKWKKVLRENEKISKLYFINNK